MDRDRMEPGRDKQPIRQDTPFPTRFGRNKRRRSRTLWPLGGNDAGEPADGEQHKGDADDAPRGGNGPPLRSPRNP